MPDACLKAEMVRILVVEDDANNRIVITGLLRMAGIPRDHILETAGDAVSFLRETGAEVDLIFLDLQLPRKDGFSILEELRADSRTAGARVVAMTANVMRSNVERCRSAGFDGFVGKPIDGRRFGETLSRILAGESVWLVA